MIPLMKNAFLNEQETRKALSEFILQAPRLSMDNQCFSFEAEFAHYQGRKFAVLFNSGGSANLAMMQSCRNLGLLKEGCNVGFSALTWSTNVMPIIQLGMHPIPVDCDPETLNVMSTNLLKRLEDVRLDALFITNALGFAGDLAAIERICKERDIILIEDNCEALGTELAGRKAGNFSIASSFSFYVAHHMSTIEGGMVCTDDDEFAQMLKIVRANGWDRNLTGDEQTVLRKKYGIENEFEAKYTFYDLGFNLRPTEITGFLGRAQLRSLEKSIQARERNYRPFESNVIANPELICPSSNHITKLSDFGFPILCRTPEIRKKYLRRFSQAEVEVRPLIAGNIQRQPFYSKYVDHSYELSGTEFLHSRGFYCGNYPELSEADLEIILECVSL